MRKIILLLMCFLSFNLFAAPQTFLQMNSEQGDYIGQGLDYYFTEADGAFSARPSYAGNPDHFKKSVSFSFMAPGFTDWWYLDFSTRQLSINLQKGTYQAQRFPFEPVGFAGLNVSGNGRGSNTLMGSFTIVDIDYNVNGEVNRFAASFEQHSEGSTAALFGRIAYNSAAFYVNESSSAILLAIGIAGFFIRKRH